MTELETKFTAVEPHEVAWYFFSYTQDEEISFDCKNKVCQALYEFCPLLLWTEFVESSLLMNLRCTSMNSFSLKKGVERVLEI